MSWAVDTNVLLRTPDLGDPAQQVTEAALVALRRSGESLYILPQNLIEFWAVATRPVANNGLGLSSELVEVQVNHLKVMFTLLSDVPEIFPEWERIVLQYRVQGKQVHDAHLVAAMTVNNLTHLLTFNTTDFKRFSAITAVSPQSAIDDQVK